MQKSSHMDSKVIHGLTDMAIALWAFLMTMPTLQPHGFGECMLSDVMEHFGWTLPKSRSAMRELKAAGWIKMDEDRGLVLIPSYLDFENIKEIRMDRRKAHLKRLARFHESPLYPIASEIIRKKWGNNYAPPAPPANRNFLKHQVFVEEFDKEIWPLYPRKRNRKEAMQEYCARRRGGIKKEDLLLALENYRKECIDEGRDPNHIMHGATFFGWFERWKDYLKPEEKVFGGLAGLKEWAKANNGNGEGGEGDQGDVSEGDSNAGGLFDIPLGGLEKILDRDKCPKQIADGREDTIRAA